MRFLLKILRGDAFHILESNRFHFPFQRLVVGKAEPKKLVERNHVSEGVIALISDLHLAEQFFLRAGQFIFRQTLSGQATFYGGNVQGGTCSFSTYTLPSGLYGTALSDSNWSNSANCGGCVAVTYGGKTITAMASPQFFLSQFYRR